MHNERKWDNKVIQSIHLIRQLMMCETNNILDE